MGEAGFALVDVTVAVALLVSILIPASALGIRLMGEQRQRHEMIALALTRALMEETLSTHAYTADTIRIARTRWRLEREVATRNGLMTIVVRVFHGSNRRPQVSLATVRPAPAQPP